MKYICVSITDEKALIFFGNHISELGVPTTFKELNLKFFEIFKSNIETENEEKAKHFYVQGWVVYKINKDGFVHKILFDDTHNKKTGD